eukprot:CAMPEP_0114160472 /NCGR_PEP_ID=MMETSP0043_2-20121206/28370_1 /TAXON_ID=464988 /ORGANISM="Hemiselmis andersenii, Strain CCMP644" /LENGTH=71 /DNA_ID=CAMNT_0001256503 /DNA_START=45 /DNA_END=256 /DNA_ORIENTATION=-
MQAEALMALGTEEATEREHLLNRVVAGIMRDQTLSGKERFERIQKAKADAAAGVLVLPKPTAEKHGGSTAS